MWPSGRLEPGYDFIASESLTLYIFIFLIPTKYVFKVERVRRRHRVSNHWHRSDCYLYNEDQECYFHFYVVTYSVIATSEFWPRCVYLLYTYCFTRRYVGTQFYYIYYCLLSYPFYCFHLYLHYWTRNFTNLNVSTRLLNKVFDISKLCFCETIMYILTTLITELFGSITNWI